MLLTIETTKTYRQLDEFVNSLADRNLTFYASDLLNQKGCRTMDELSQALKRATQVCNNMHLPLRENFKVVYRSQEGEVVQDWRLSPMAYLLMVLNSDSSNDFVAHIQVEMVKRILQQEKA
ncbi:hypothetical protein ACFSKU_11580 [Pontibacter silvestris]|uniref:Uncharacterized protein n=1 Tax=Pontibacter silvestris TaxID=2305183 RepID=A0ABW4X042_9BACT|nr:hypothetical protein [Pontibacter silvestris]MCC9135342.1 hypothetical protein [Pontibacter silvestris]